MIYPPRPFRALELTPLHSVRAVILGQDPYHGPGQAEGLAFSVRAGVKLPPSLRNIFKELGCAADEPQPPTGSLVDWARRGVLLLNASLTVEDGQPGSHARKGWEVADRCPAGRSRGPRVALCVHALGRPCPGQGGADRGNGRAPRLRGPGAAGQPSVAPVGRPAAGAVPRLRPFRAGA